MKGQAVLPRTGLVRKGIEEHAKELVKNNLSGGL